MKKNITAYILILIIALTGILSGCSSSADKPTDLVYYGTVEAEKVNISAEISGIIQDITVSEGDIIEAGALVAQINAPEAEIKLQQAELAVKNAENELEKLEENSKRSISDTTRNTFEYAIENAKKSYDIAKLQKEKSKITAKVKGAVETVNFEKGEYINIGSNIITLTDNSNLWLTIYVPEKEISNIMLDKKVNLKNDYVNDSIQGEIVFIASEAEFTPMNIITKKDREKLVYEVKIAILNKIEDIKPGMLMDVHIE